jgi:Spy/CpxP family protein refolding chaperone
MKLSGKIFICILLLSLAGCSTAQPEATADLTSPYIDQLDNPIRGMTLDEIADLETGAGAGFARAAELNGYPGPRHILDLQDELDMTPDQLEQVESLFDEMNAAARGLGEEILEMEADLELAFSEGAIDETSLEMKVTALAAKYGELRLLHLQTHLVSIEILTSEQVSFYNELRGYGDHGGMQHDTGHEMP